MRQHPRADWRKFRNIVKEYCEHMLRYSPVIAKRKWIVICYQSFGAFEKRFPTAELRSKVIKELGSIDKRFEAAFEDCRPILDAIPTRSKGKS